ncbi:HAD family hydrolase [Saccharopolyspora cebuensis]|uniref:HAD family hydrolase n=1 Tax=Saccharopolyspora cebuensis TaxID=418759 RepID=A0ABV4CG62_9PSEU
MRPPRLIASDVDGTLLGPLERLTARTTATVRRATAAGVPFVLVTGRPPRWLGPLVDELGGVGFAVCANGAVRYDVAADRILGSHLIDPLVLHDAVHDLREELPGCTFAVERVGDRARGTTAAQFLAEPGFRRSWAVDVRTAPPDELTGKPAVKLLVVHDELTSAEMAPAAEEVLAARLGVTYSTGSGLLELSAPGVDKATGLAEVAEELGVPRGEVIAFGDMPNDVPMLRWAGRGIAVRNAHPAVLAVADEVAPSNAEDGVAAVLERWW